MNISMSLDGYTAGPTQSQDHSLGTGGMQLHESPDIGGVP